MEGGCKENLELLKQSFSALQKNGALELFKNEATPLYQSSSPFTVVESAINKLKLSTVQFGVFSVKDLADDNHNQIFKDIINGPGPLIKEYQNLKYTLVNNSVFIKASETLECHDFLSTPTTNDPNGVPLKVFFDDILSNECTSPDLNGLAQIFDKVYNSEDKEAPFLDNVESISSSHPFYRLFANANPIQFVEPATVKVNIPICTISSFGCVTPTQCPINGLYLWDILLPLSKPKLWMVLHSCLESATAEGTSATNFEANLQNTIKQVLKEEHDEGQNRIDPTKFPDSCHYPLRSQCFLFSPEHLHGNHCENLKMSVFIQQPGESVLVGPNVYFSTASTGKSISFQLNQLGYSENQSSSVSSYIPCPRHASPSFLLFDCGHSQQHFITDSDKQLKRALKYYNRLVSSDFSNANNKLFDKGTLDLKIAAKAVKMRLTVFVPFPLKKPKEGKITWITSPGVAYKMSSGKVKVFIVNSDNVNENENKKCLKFNPLFVFITKRECDGLVQRINASSDSVTNKFGIDSDDSESEDRDASTNNTKTLTKNIKAFPFRYYPPTRELVKPFVRKKPSFSTAATAATITNMTTSSVTSSSSSLTPQTSKPEVITIEDDDDDASTAIPQSCSSIPAKQEQQRPRKRKRKSTITTSSSHIDSSGAILPPPDIAVPLDLSSPNSASLSLESSSAVLVSPAAAIPVPLDLSSPKVCSSPTVTTNPPPTKRNKNKESKSAMQPVQASSSKPTTMTTPSPSKTDLEALQKAMLNAKEFIGIGLAAVSRLIDDDVNKDGDEQDERQES